MRNILGGRRNLFLTHRKTVTALLMAGAFLNAGCDTVAPPISDQPGAFARVHLSPGDVVKLTFPGAADFNQTQKIRADGNITLPIIGEVRAAGKTLPQFQSELIQLYKAQLTNSDVLVTLESALIQVYITGAVGHPGKMAFERPTTILQAIMEAGGPTEFGSLRNVKIVRLQGGQQRTFSVDLRSTMAGATTRAAYVKDGDVISVPATAF